MSQSFGLIGNGRVLAKIQADGALTEAFFPSIGFYRHILQSQFGLFEKSTGKSIWLSVKEFDAEQRYLEDTNVVQTTFARGPLRLTLTDFVHPETNVIVRTLEVRNTGRASIELGIFHMEASSLEENKGNFGHNVAYYNSLDHHVVRYRGHPFDNTVEAHACLLIAGTPVQDQIQCGVSYQADGPCEDAFLDVADGKLRHNPYSSGDSMGATTALLWMRSLGPAEATEVTVYLSGGVTLVDAEEQLVAARRRGPKDLLRSCVEYWREWLEIGRAHEPALTEHRLQLLFRRSLLMLKLLQDERFGSFIAAPNLYPDYRYCWPRDAVFLAWAMDCAGYHDEVRQFYRWCKRTQMADGLWYQNHYTDGRRHWPGIQVDQVSSIVWGLHQHHLACPSGEFLQEMWPMVERATWYVLSRIHPDLGLVFSEQDLWEETCGYLTYTNASCIAALHSAAAIAAELGQQEEARLWPECAHTLEQHVKRHLIQDGVYVGEYDAKRSFPVRHDYRLDVSNVGMSFPFAVVSPNDPVMTRTVAAFEAEFGYPIGGVGRYKSDLFVGGNPWSLAAVWLGLYYASAGRKLDAIRHIDWCLKHAVMHDFIPEQSDKRTGDPASAQPLAWSHAWMVILLQRLAALTSSGAASRTSREPAVAPGRERRP
jgi:oligosaccharide amylase